MTLYPIWMNGLPPDMAKKAEEELGETEEVKAQALEELKRLIHDEEDFKPLMDDAFLLRFLRVRKFDVVKAFNNLRNYYTFRLQHSKVLTDFKPSEFMKIYDLNFIDVAPKRLENGSSVGIGRLGYFDIDSFTFEDLAAACIMCGEVGIDPEMSQVCGGIIIIDLENFSLRMIKYFASPKLMYTLVRAVQDCLPLRLTGFYIVNEPTYIHLLYDILKLFISKKLRKRIRFFGSNLKALHEKVPPEILPEELGGHLGPFDNSDFRKRLLSYEAYFENMKKFGYQGKQAQMIRTKNSNAPQLLPVTYRSISSQDIPSCADISHASTL